MRDRMIAVLVAGAVGLGPACSTSDEARPADPAQASEDDGAAGSTRRVDAVGREAVHVVDPLVWQQGGLPAARLVLADLRSTLLP